MVITAYVIRPNTYTFQDVYMRMDTMEFYTKAELSCYFSSVYYFTMQETYSHVRTRKKKKKLSNSVVFKHFEWCELPV